MLRFSDIRNQIAQLRAAEAQANMLDNALRRGNLGPNYQVILGSTVGHLRAARREMGQSPAGMVALRELPAAQAKTSATAITETTSAARVRQMRTSLEWPLYCTFQVMAEDTETPKTGGKNTDLAEGELETVEDSLRIHEGKVPAPKPEKPEPDRRNLDLAEGERETVEESIRIHEKKGDLQDAGARRK